LILFRIYTNSFPIWLCSPLDLGHIFSFLIPYIVGRAPCAGNQPVARSLPTHRTAQTQNKRTQISMRRVGFEPTFLVLEPGEDGSYLRPRGHCDGNLVIRVQIIVSKIPSPNYLLEPVTVCDMNCLRPRGRSDPGFESQLVLPYLVFLLCVRLSLFVCFATS
jgi:hypothetical protein